LVAAAANTEVVNHLILEHTVGIDDEQPSQRQVLARDVNTVSLTNRTPLVGGQREAQSSQSALDARRGHPALMRLNGVGANGQKVAVSLEELIVTKRESSQLRGANEGKVSRIEHQDQPSVTIVGQRRALSLVTGNWRDRQVEVGGTCANHGRQLAKA